VALTIQYPEGATPLDADEMAGLIPSGISTRSQLDELEAANIVDALNWALDGKHDVLSDEFARKLHQRMFGNVWKWAGNHRASEKNIGIAPHDIGASMQDLMKDVRAQIASGQLTAEEIAVHFHHRLTKIHAFANGNGRHARLMTDLLLGQLGREPFEWGASDLVHEGDVRTRYIAALRSADAKDYAPLREFLEVRK
jgi:Fic-DOC domain mobile mystery protein B